MSGAIPSVSTDFTQYEKLRADGSLPEVARRFEGLFIEMMLKSMRDGLPKGGMFDSDQSKLYQQMYDRQIADSMAAGKGIGIADMLVRQMTGTSPGSSAVGATSVANQPFAAHAALTSSGSSAVGATSVAIEPPASPDEFIAQVLPHAQEAAKALGVPVDAVLAQAALESGWGGAAHGFNFFGIKADNRWSGPVVDKSTLEVRDGVVVRERATFRAYGSAAEGFRDFVAFLRDNPRYKAVIEGARDLASFAEGLQKAGYATDPEYAAKIKRVAGSNTLRNALAGVTGG